MYDYIGPFDVGGEDGVVPHGGDGVGVGITDSHCPHVDDGRGVGEGRAEELLDAVGPVRSVLVFEHNQSLCYRVEEWEETYHWIWEVWRRRYDQFQRVAVVVWVFTYKRGGSEEYAQAHREE